MSLVNNTDCIVKTERGKNTYIKVNNVTTVSGQIFRKC